MQSTVEKKSENDLNNKEVYEYYRQTFDELIEDFNTEALDPAVFLQNMVSQVSLMKR